MDTQMTVMTPRHPRWREFIFHLEGPAGCNFRKDTKGQITWDCAGGNDQSYARDILEEMGGIDVAASLAYFSEHGGYCDCEILFNVEDSAKNE